MKNVVSVARKYFNHVAFFCRCLSIYILHNMLAVYPAFVQCILTHQLLVLTHDKDGPAENSSLHVVKCRQLQALHVCRVDGLWVEDVLIVEHVLKAGPVDCVYQCCPAVFR